MSLLLRILEPQLTSPAARAGFVLAERSSGTEDHPEIGQLEYVAVTPGRRRVLLDFCHVMATQTISATQWSPDDLVRALPEAGIESVARHHRVWRYDAATDPHAIVREIAPEVMAWFDPVPVDENGGGRRAAVAGR
jgi:hypothetical protein